LTQLRTHLNSQGRAWFRADGCSSNGAHVERGYAFSASVEEAAAHAARWTQAAVFWFDGDRFWLVPAGDQQEATPLPYKRL
jgi:hypothetical protein